MFLHRIEVAIEKVGGASGRTATCVAQLPGTRRGVDGEIDEKRGRAPDRVGADAAVGESRKHGKFRRLTERDSCGRTHIGAAESRR